MALSLKNALMAFVAVIAAGIGVSVAAALIALTLDLARPAGVVSVPLPILGATAKVEVWRGLAGESYRIKIETPHGSIDWDLWTNWGPADRINLYKTPDDWLVTLGAGGVSEMFAVSAEATPRRISDQGRQRDDSRSWSYVGAVDRQPGGGWRFYSPAEKSECFVMFGAGSSPHRIAFQTPSACR